MPLRLGEEGSLYAEVAVPFLLQIAIAGRWSISSSDPNRVLPPNVLSWNKDCTHTILTDHGVILEKGNSFFWQAIQSVIDL